MASLKDCSLADPRGRSPPGSLMQRAAPRRERGALPLHLERIGLNSDCEDDASQTRTAFESRVAEEDDHHREGSGNTNDNNTFLSSSLADRRSRGTSTRRALSCPSPTSTSRMQGLVSGKMHSHTKDSRSGKLGERRFCSINSNVLQDQGKSNNSQRSRVNAAAPVQSSRSSPFGITNRVLQLLSCLKDIVAWRCSCSILSREKDATNTAEIRKENSKRPVITVDLADAGRERPLVSDCVKGLGWKVSPFFTGGGDIAWLGNAVPDAQHAALAPSSVVVNRFPGLHEYAKKRWFARVLSSMQELQPEEFAFFPLTWVLPEDREAVEAVLCRHSKLPSSSSSAFVSLVSSSSSSPSSSASSSPPQPPPLLLPPAFSSSSSSWSSSASSLHRPFSSTSSSTAVPPPSSIFFSSPFSEGAHPSTSSAFSSLPRRPPGSDPSTTLFPAAENPAGEKLQKQSESLDGRGAIVCTSPHRRTPANGSAIREKRDRGGRRGRNAARRSVGAMFRGIHRSAAHIRLTIRAEEEEEEKEARQVKEEKEEEERVKKEEEDNRKGGEQEEDREKENAQEESKKRHRGEAEAPLRSAGEAGRDSDKKAVEREEGVDGEAEGEGNRRAVEEEGEEELQKEDWEEIKRGEQYGNKRRNSGSTAENADKPKAAVAPATAPAAEERKKEGAEAENRRRARANAPTRKIEKYNWEGRGGEKIPPSIQKLEAGPPTRYLAESSPLLQQASTPTLALSSQTLIGRPLCSSHPSSASLPSPSTSRKTSPPAASRGLSAKQTLFAARLPPPPASLFALFPLLAWPAQRGRLSRRRTGGGERGRRDGERGGGRRGGERREGGKRRDLPAAHTGAKKRDFFILKPDAGAQGMGVRLLSAGDTLSADILLGKDGYVMQHYISNPFLLRGRKFDFRIYVLLLNVSPQPQVFLSRRGLVRVCTEDYRFPDEENLQNTFVHLTNYAINKAHKEYRRSADVHAPYTNKRLLEDVFEELMLYGVNVELVWEQVVSIVRKTMAALTPLLSLQYKSVYGQQSSRCFQILGADILLDANCKAWLLEINANPSLRCDYDGPGVCTLESEVDRHIKEPLIREALVLVYFSTLSPRGGTALSRRRNDVSCKTLPEPADGAAEKGHQIEKNVRNKKKPALRDRKVLSSLTPFSSSSKRVDALIYVRRTSTTLRQNRVPLARRENAAARPPPLPPRSRPPPPPSGSIHSLLRNHTPSRPTRNDELHGRRFAQKLIATVLPAPVSRLLPRPHPATAAAAAARAPHFLSSAAARASAVAAASSARSGTATLPPGHSLVAETAAQGTGKELPSLCLLPQRLPFCRMPLAKWITVARPSCRFQRREAEVQQLRGAAPRRVVRAAHAWTATPPRRDAAVESSPHATPKEAGKQLPLTVASVGLARESTSSPPSLHTAGKLHLTAPNRGAVTPFRHGGGEAECSRAKGAIDAEGETQRDAVNSAQQKQIESRKQQHSSDYRAAQHREAEKPRKQTARGGEAGLDAEAAAGSFAGEALLLLSSLATTVTVNTTPCKANEHTTSSCCCSPETVKPLRPFSAEPSAPPLLRSAPSASACNKGPCSSDASAAPFSSCQTLSEGDPRYTSRAEQTSAAVAAADDAPAVANDAVAAAENDAAAATATDAAPATDAVAAAETDAAAAAHDAADGCAATAAAASPASSLADAAAAAAGSAATFSVGLDARSPIHSKSCKSGSSALRQQGDGVSLLPPLVVSEMKTTSGVRRVMLRRRMLLSGNRQAASLGVLDTKTVYSRSGNGRKRAWRRGAVGIRRAVSLVFSRRKTTTCGRRRNTAPFFERGVAASAGSKASASVSGKKMRQPTSPLTGRAAWVEAGISTRRWPVVRGRSRGSSARLSLVQFLLKSSRDSDAASWLSSKGGGSTRAPVATWKECDGETSRQGWERQEQQASRRDSGAARQTSSSKALKNCRAAASEASTRGTKCDSSLDTANQCCIWEPLEFCSVQLPGVDEASKNEKELHALCGPALVTRCKYLFERLTRFPARRTVSLEDWKRLCKQSRLQDIIEYLWVAVPTESQGSRAVTGKVAGGVRQQAVRTCRRFAQRPLSKRDLVLIYMRQLKEEIRAQAGAGALENRGLSFWFFWELLCLLSALTDSLIMRQRDSVNKQLALTGSVDLSCCDSTLHHTAFPQGGEKRGRASGIHVLNHAETNLAASSRSGGCLGRPKPTEETAQLYPSSWGRCSPRGDNSDNDNAAASWRGASCRSNDFQAGECRKVAEGAEGSVNECSPRRHDIHSPGSLHVSGEGEARKSSGKGKSQVSNYYNFSERSKHCFRLMFVCQNFPIAAGNNLSCDASGAFNSLSVCKPCTEQYGEAVKDLIVSVGERTFVQSFPDLRKQFYSMTTEQRTKALDCLLSFFGIQEDKAG